jgi:hypothetical protein
MHSAAAFMSPTLEGPATASQLHANAPAPPPPSPPERPPAFNIVHSVHMARFAFAAYQQPVEHLSYAAKDPDGANTMYLDPVFIKTHFKAVVTVTVLSATGLPQYLGPTVRSAYTRTQRCTSACV